MVLAVPQRTARARPKAKPSNALHARTNRAATAASAAHALKAKASKAQNAAMAAIRTAVLTATPSVVLSAALIVTSNKASHNLAKANAHPALTTTTSSARPSATTLASLVTANAAAGMTTSPHALMHTSALSKVMLATIARAAAMAASLILCAPA